MQQISVVLKQKSCLKFAVYGTKRTFYFMAKMRNIPIYQVQDFESRQQSFYANKLSSHIVHHGFVNRPHKHDFYLSIYFTKGTGTHTIDFTKYKVSPGCLFFMSPGQVHHWKLSADVEGFIFFHSAQFYDSVFASHKISDYPFFNTFSGHRMLKCNSDLCEGILPRMAAVWNEFSSSRNERKLLALADLLYLEAEPHFDRQGSEQYQVLGNYLEKLQAFKRLIEEHYPKHLKVSKYAQMLNITPKHLNRICNDTLNKTTTAILAERVILEAMRLLSHTQFSVKEVAEKLGFKDASYFVRLFRKINNTTPMAFQKKLHG